MFSFGEQEKAPVKPAANKKKSSRRVSLADRSRNDENAMPPSTPSRAPRGPAAGKGASMQTHQAFLQATTKPPTIGTCAAPTTPSGQAGGGGAGGRGRGGGGGAAATQMVNQNLELRRRQQELEAMVQSCEAATNRLQEENAQLRRQSTRARADAEEANARADSASAETEGLRRDLKTASAEIEGLRRDLTAARDETARVRAEAEAATARTEAAELASARAAEELVREKKAAAKAEDAARRASKAVTVETAKAAKAAAAAAAASKAAASAKAAAAADVAAAARVADVAKATAAAEVAAAAAAAKKATAAATKKAASAAAAAATAEAALKADREDRHLKQEQRKLQPEVKSLAASLEKIAAGGCSYAEGVDVSSLSKPGKKRGRGAAGTGGGGGGGSRKVASTRAGEGEADLPELTKGFCGFLAEYASQGMPLDVLLRLIEATPPLRKRGTAGDNNGQKADVPPPSPPLPSSVAAERTRPKPQAVGLLQDQSASAVPAAGDGGSAFTAAAPASAAATSPLLRADAAAAGTAAAGMETPAEKPAPAVRPTTSRREMLNARRAQQEADAREKERVKEEQERARVERQRQARQKRKKEAARQKAAAEAAARQQPVEGTTAGLEAAAAPPFAVPPPPPQEPKQEYERAARSPDLKEPSKALPVKSKIAKDVPQQQQKKKKRHAHQSSVKRCDGDGGTEAGRGTDAAAVLAGVQPPLLLPTAEKEPAASASGAKEQPGEGFAATHTAATPAAHEGHQEVGGVVEEVPMPAGDIDDGFFCPGEVGGGGLDGGCVGLIVGGGGGDEFGVVGAWPQQQYDPIATAGSGGGGLDTAVPGERRRKGKGRPRKENVAGPDSGLGGVEAREDGEGEDAKEGKKKRRRSMRLVRPPTKFGSEEEPQVEKVGGGAPNAKRPAPGSGVPAGAAALGDEDQDPNSSARRNIVAPAPVFRALSPESIEVEGAAAASMTAAPGAGAGAGASAGDAPVAVVSSAAVDVPSAGDFTAQLNALPVKRKRNIRTIRFRGGGLLPASAATPSALSVTSAATPAAPFSGKREDNAATSDLFAAVADAGADISPKDKISAAATVARKAVDSLFDTAALQLSAAAAAAAAQPSSKPAAPAAAAAVAAATSRVAGGHEGKPLIHAGAAPVSAGVARVSKPKAKVVAAVERSLPFGAEVTDGVTVRDIVDAACSRSWFGRTGAAAEGPRGALTGVLATAQVLMEKHAKVSGSGSASGSGSGSGSGSTPSAPFSGVSSEPMRHFEALLTAVAAAEACAMRHELRAGTEAGEAVPSSLGVGGSASTAATGTTSAGGRKKKRVRFCAYDLSTIDMPSDAIEDSDSAAKEVAQCLARVVASSKLLQKALPEHAAGGAGRAAAKVANGAGAGGGVAAVLKAFTRGLKTVAAIAEPGSSPLVAAVKDACCEFGSEVSADVVQRAARFLLESLESLEGGAEVAARCPLRRRLAGMLSALIRFNMRVLLNPPPHKSVSSLHIADSTDEPRKVYEVIQLVSEEVKPGNKKDAFDPTRDGATSAVLSRALRRLYGFSEEGAVQVISTAEAFVADAKSRTGDLSDEDKALQARRHSLETVDVVAALRARSFVLELLEFPGVELAVSQTRGWGELERLSTELRQVKDCPDADASLTLLGEVEGLKAWLRRDSAWGGHIDGRAKAVLTRLDEVLVGCDRKEAKRLSQEARRRMWFPSVKSPEPLQEVANQL